MHLKKADVHYKCRVCLFCIIQSKSIFNVEMQKRGWWKKIDLKDDLVGGASSSVQTTVALSRGVIKNWFVTSLIGY
jgi:hypothetical protein